MLREQMLSFYRHRQRTTLQKSLRASIREEQELSMTQADALSQSEEEITELRVAISLLQDGVRRLQSERHPDFGVQVDCCTCGVGGEGADNR